MRDESTTVGRHSTDETRTTSRRGLLVTLGGGAALLAGCSGGGSGPETTTAERTEPGTTASATPDITNALDDARADIEEAIEALAAHELVADGGPNLALDHIQGYEPEAVTDPAAAARERLSDVETTGTATGQIERLVALTRYLDGKADLYLQLIAAQISTVQFKRRFASDETTMSGAYRTVDEAFAFVDRVPDRLDRTETLLDGVAGGAPQIGGFGPGAERTELDVLQSVVGDLRLIIVGFRAYTGAFLTAGEASSSYQSGEYARAEQEFDDATEAMELAEETLSRVKDRSSEYHHEGFVELFECQTDDLAAAFGGFTQSAQAKADGDHEKAAELSTAAEVRIAEMRGACLEGDD